MENKITEINGIQLYQSFIAGAQRIFENQKLLNKINIFPVADADTGTNLASTMRSIVNTAQPQENLKHTAVALADAALVGARGNSGIIFAQFLYGFSNEIQEEEKLTARAFAEYMNNAVRYAYEAIANPVEGTMISVIKDWAESLYQAKDVFDDFVKLLTDGLEKAMESLKMTTIRLAALAKTNMVDAGAKGFVVFLEGMFDYFKNGQKAVSILNDKIEVADKFDSIQHQVITYRYCTEAMFCGENMTRKKFASIMKPLGDSLVIAGSSTKMRIHIHTDKPWELFEKIGHLGTITYKKVEDMVMQNAIASNRKYKIGLVTDSTCDIPMELLEKYQINVVPLTIHFGDDFYIDGITLKPEQFFDKLKNSDIFPTSAQPSNAEFTNRYNYLSTHFDSIISAHISSEMSGTWQSSLSAANKISSETGKKISVLNTKRITSGLGLVVLRIADAIEKGMSHDEITNKIDEWAEKTRLLVSAKTMKYMVKSGRLAPIKGFVGNMLGIRPVVELSDKGVAEVFGIPVGKKKNYELVLNELKRFIGTNKVWNFAITHADNLEDAQKINDELKKITGKDAIFINGGSPVLVSKVGPGVVAVSVMLE